MVCWVETLLSAVNVVIYRAKPKEARVGRTGIVLSVQERHCRPICAGEGTCEDMPKETLSPRIDLAPLTNGAKVVKIPQKMKNESGRQPQKPPNFLIEVEQLA